MIPILLLLRIIDHEKCSAIISHFPKDLLSNTGTTFDFLMTFSLTPDWTCIQGNSSLQFTSKKRSCPSPNLREKKRMKQNQMNSVGIYHNVQLYYIHKSGSWFYHIHSQTEIKGHILLVKAFTYRQKKIKIKIKILLSRVHLLVN